jgi:DNA (cytosine-5)-methyltransferase 3A
MNKQEKQYTVLSLFDGLSCGRIALERANIPVKKYYASEIDKYAMKVSADNYPDTVQLGSVIDLTEKQLLDLGPIDLLIGGSPCQGFSISGKMNGSSTSCGKEVTTLEQYLILKEMGFEFDGQSYLFWEYVRIWKIVKPKYFFLENVRVTKKWLPMFNEAMKVEPIMINSNLVSAQNRVRFYWTNIPNFSMPTDLHIYLSDILDPIKDDHEFSAFSTESIRISKSVKPGVAKNIRRCHSDIVGSDRDFYDMKATSGFQDNKIGLKKSVTLRAGNDCAYVLQQSTSVYRKLTPVECARLQTIPDNYCSSVSKSQQCKMIGNAWTIDIIVHFFKSLPL